MKYEKLVFYGDSFTWGQDSGGDDVYDETKTYPHFFGNIVKKQVVNKGMPGLSNLGILYNMMDYIHYCYYNEDKDLLRDTLNVVNLSSSLRGTVTCNNRIESEKYSYVCNLSDQVYKEVKFGVFGPSYPHNNSTPHLNKSMEVYYNEADMRICLDQYMILLAMKDISERYGMGIVFVDVLFEKHMLEVSNSFSFHHLNVPFIDFENEMGKTCLISSTPKDIAGSKSRHFYEEGYRWMANAVHDKLKSHHSYLFSD